MAWKHSNEYSNARSQCVSYWKVANVHIFELLQLQFRFKIILNYNELQTYNVLTTTTMNL